MIKCYQCGGTNLWSLMWVRANPISFMMVFDEDTEPYEEVYPNDYHKCDDCKKQVQIIEGD